MNAMQNVFHKLFAHHVMFMNKKKDNC